MSTQTKKSDVKHLKQYYGIAKICFYIMVFNIVVRIDLWISIAGMIFLLPYLLHNLLLKKIDAAKYLALFNRYVDAIKKVQQKPKQSQGNKGRPIPENTLDQAKSEELDFVEPSFEEIWQNCPQDDFVWDDQPIHEEHNDERKFK